MKLLPAMLGSGRWLGLSNTSKEGWHDADEKDGIDLGVDRVIVPQPTAAVRPISTSKLNSMAQLRSPLNSISLKKGRGQTQMTQIYSGIFAPLRELFSVDSKLLIEFE